LPLERVETRDQRGIEIIGGEFALRQLGQLPAPQQDAEDIADRDVDLHAQDNPLRPLGRALQPLGPPRRRLRDLDQIADEQDHAAIGLDRPHRRA